MSQAPHGSRPTARVCLVTAVLVAASPLVTRAASQQLLPDTRPVDAVALVPAGPPADAPVVVLAAPRSPSPDARSRQAFGPARRPAMLPSLYVAFAGLQVLDADSTLRAPRGTREVNPLMGELRHHPVAMFSAKAGVTAATIYASERLWKQKRRRAAIALMVAVNCAWTVVVANNYRHQR